MVNYDDKRNFYRMLLNSEVRITVIDDEVNTDLVATCRDLSATGMAIEMSHPIEPGISIRARVDSSNSSIQSLDVSGKVIRVEEESPECYLVGLSIEDID
jgi:c-di-GMP-binding flagellar brake protein YcgR